MLSLAEIRRTLSWQYCDTESMIEDYEAYLLNLFSRSMDRSLKDFEVDLTKHQSSFKRFLKSPAISAMLRTIEWNNFPDHLLYNFREEFQQWINFENGICIADSYTSPSGNYIYNRQSGYQFNLLLHDLCVDFEFPLVWQHIDVSKEHFKEICDEREKKVCVKKVKDALQFINQENKEAYSFIRRFTQLIHVRKTVHGVPPGSSSNILRNGATVLRGIEHHEITYLDVAEFLLHESIHHALYVYEILVQPFDCQRLKSRPIHSGVQSPWSANLIATDSFIHACFVWYGLYNFWARIDSDSLNVRLKSMISSEGFLKPISLTDQLKINRHELSPDLLEALDQMQIDVRAREIA